MATQIIQLSTPDTILEVGQEFEVLVTYNVSDPQDNTLTGIGFRIHFNSNELQLNEINTTLTTSLFGNPNGTDETVTDGDPATDKFVTWQYLDLFGAWPNQNLPITLGVLKFKALESYDGSQLNLTFSSTAGGFTGVGESLELGLYIEPTNTPPTISLNNETNSLPENVDTTSPIKVADIVLTDDAIGTNSLSLSGTDAPFFEIVGSELFVKAGTNLDFETKVNYSVVVVVDDPSIGATPDDTEIFNLTLTNVNEVPTNLVIGASSVDENVSANTVIGILATTDPDVGDTFTYSLVAGTGDTDNATFSIVNNQLQINNSPDFETKNSYGIRVKTIDQGGLGFEKGLTITVNNVNEAPTVANPIADQTATQDQLFTFTVPSNTFTDVDGDELFYSAFLEDGTTPLPSWLTFNAQSLEFIGTPENGDIGSLNIGVFANDGFLSTFDVFDIVITSPPGTIQFNNSAYAVNEDGTVVNEIILTRTGGNDGAVSVTVTPSNGTATSPADFTANPIVVNFANGETSKTVAIPIVDDTVFEGNETINLNLSNATGGAVLGSQTTAVLTIVDNESPPVNLPPSAVNLLNPVTQLAENTTIGTGVKVAEIQVADDGLGTNTLSLTGTDAASFAIENNELYFVGTSPDFETQAQYQVTVNVDDPTVGNTPDASTNFALEITNLFDSEITGEVTRFTDGELSDNLGSLVYDLANVTENAQAQLADEALQQTDAAFHNLFGLYEVQDTNGAVLDLFDANNNGSIADFLNPGDTGYARSALSQLAHNFILQLGANGQTDKNSSASDLGDILLNGGKIYAPFAIANGGALIPASASLTEVVTAFLDQNPENTAATLENYWGYQVAYFSFGVANPDGAEHLQSRGEGIFGFEDLPGNLGVSDFDFNDAVFQITFLV